MTAISLQNTLYDTFGVLGTFSFRNFVWDKYQSYAIPKINRATMALKELTEQTKQISYNTLQEQIAFLEDYTSHLEQLPLLIESMEDEDAYRFKKSAKAFVEALHTYKRSLEKAEYEQEKQAFLEHNRRNASQIFSKHLEYEV